MSESRVKRPNLRKKFRVVSLNNPNVITEVHGDLVNTVVRTGEQGRKGVSHNVRCNPLTALLRHVFLKRSGKIVAVTILTVSLFGVKHEGLAQTVFVPNERQELSRQRNAPFFPVLELDRFGFSEMEFLRLQIEPERSSLCDFLCSQSSMESAEQDKLQILAAAFVDEFFYQPWWTEVASADSSRWLNSEPFRRIFSNRFLNVATPVKEATNRHHVSVGCARAVLLGAFSVVSDQIGGSNVGRGHRAAPIGKPLEHVTFAVLSSSRPCWLFTGAHVSNESLNSVFHHETGLQLGIMPQPRGFQDCFRQIASVQGNKVALLFFLNSKPINVSALVNTTSKPLSPIHVKDCSRGSVTLGNCKGVTSERIGLEIPGVYGARTRNLCRDRIEYVIGSVTLSMSQEAA